MLIVVLPKKELHRSLQVNTLEARRSASRPEAPCRPSRSRWLPPLQDITRKQQQNLRGLFWESLCQPKWSMRSMVSNSLNQPEPIISVRFLYILYSIYGFILGTYKIVGSGWLRKSKGLFWGVSVLTQRVHVGIWYIIGN